jgi:CNT family concentrative nucleoside transporter
MDDIVRGALGLAVFLGIAWLTGERPLAQPWRRQARLIAAGLALQIGIAVLLLKFVLFQQAFLVLNHVVSALQASTMAGTRFVFGFLGGGTPPFQVSHPEAVSILAFQALPLVLVMSALSALLFHWRILPAVVRGLAWALRKAFGVSGPFGMAAGANVFLGMVEAPLLIRPYLTRMSRSELFGMMTCGMATIAGTVMVLYATILDGVVPDPVGQLLTASLVNVPAALLLARLMVPEPLADATKPPATVEFEVLPDAPGTALEAITQGTLAGVQLLINIIAMLVVAVALVALVDQGLAVLPAVAGEPLSLARLFGWLFTPVAWLMGMESWNEAATAGRLLGTKLILNELIAYTDLAALPRDALGERSRLIMTYALCGFANFASLGIMIGGLTTMVPERRREIVALGVRSLAAGTLATCMTATIVGML